MSKARQMVLAKKILNHRPALSIRKTEAEVKKIKSGDVTAMPDKSPDHLKLEQTLTDIVGSPIEIIEEPEQKECGRIVISYHGYQVLDGILERLGYHG